MQNHSVSTSSSVVSILPLLPEARRPSRLPGVGPSTERSLRVSHKIYRTTFAGPHKSLNKSPFHLHLQHPIAFTTAAPTENHQSIQVPYHRIIPIHTDLSHCNSSRRTSEFGLDDYLHNPPIRTHSITTYPHRSPSALFSTSSFRSRPRRPLHSYDPHHTV